MSLFSYCQLLVMVIERLFIVLCDCSQRNTLFHERKFKKRIINTRMKVSGGFDVTFLCLLIK